MTGDGATAGEQLLLFQDARLLIDCEDCQRVGVFAARAGVHEAAAGCDEDFAAGVTVGLLSGIAGPASTDAQTAPFASIPFF